MCFNYEILYVPGDEIAIADTLLRCPKHKGIKSKDMLTEQDIQTYVSLSHQNRCFFRETIARN